MTFQVKPVNDSPINDAKLLGHAIIVENLKSFIESDNLITPISIAIHGEWGSGKTSIMKTLEKKIDLKKFQVTFFEAWMHEYSNPSLGLINQVLGVLGMDPQRRDQLLEIAGIALNAVTGIDVATLLNRRPSSAGTLRKWLLDEIKKNTKNKKLVVIIDDLDRCDPENTLQILTLLKLFLDVENVICIAAVDFKRLEQAWKMKYGNENPEGSQYLDKIFQVRIGIPQPRGDVKSEYIRTLVPTIPDELLYLFSTLGPSNPRSIKKMLNLVSYRQTILGSAYANTTSSLWTLLEMILSHGTAIYFYELMKQMDTTLGEAIKTHGNNWIDLKRRIDSVSAGLTSGPNDLKLSSYFSMSKKLIDKWNVQAQDLDSDFNSLYSITNETIR